MRLVLGALLAGLALALLAAAGARWELGAARRDFDATATETVAEWSARHPPREANAAAVAMDETAKDLYEPRVRDPQPAVRGMGGQAWFVTMTHAHEAALARDATALPAPPALRAWMDAREPELDGLVALLTGAPPPRWTVAAGDVTAERVRTPFAGLRKLLLARALDDAARGMPERADRDLAAAWSLHASWSEHPRHPWSVDSETLGAIRVVEPEPAAWIARLGALQPRDDLHDEILFAATTIPTSAAAPWTGEVPSLLPRFLVSVKSPFVRAIREHAAARALRTLAALDADLARLEPCADASRLAPGLPDAWLSEDLPLGLTYWIDRRMPVRLSVSEADVALTRRVLEIRAGLARPGDPCAGARLVETPAEGGGVRVAWRGGLPPGMEAWASWYPAPFTVGGGHAGRAGGAGP